MKVSGSHLRVADTEDFEHPTTISGTGTVIGAPWRWSYLKFSMTYLPAHAPIEDANYVSPTQLIGRKTILAPTGVPVQLYELDMSRISGAEYEKHRADMGCPAQQPAAKPE